MAPPSVFSDELADRLVALLADGASPRQAAGATGTSYPTLMRWLQRGAAGDQRYRSLHEAAQQRQPAPEDLLDRLREAEPGVIGQIIAASRHDWRAAAWLAERAWPERWAPAHRRVQPDAGPNGIDPATGEVSLAHLRLVR
jgi:hypothetical protein